jgi:TP901 family phage tail tape measure protein
VELLEYLIQLHGTQVSEAQLKGIRDGFGEVGAAARDAAAASDEGAASSDAAAVSHGSAASAAGGLHSAMKKMAVAGAFSIAAIGLVAVKMANTFSTEMLKIRTEGGATSKEFRAMRTAVLNLATSGQSMGAGPTSLAPGLYHQESMGLRGSKALLALKLASEEAAISGSNLEDTTTAIGSAMYIGLKGTGSMAHMMGTLNAIVGAGNMRFQDLNEALGTGLLSTAKVAGLSLQSVGAALAVLTDAGYPASSAAAQLGTALHYLYAPTTKGQAALESIGLSGSKMAADLRKPNGLLVAMRDLRTHMRGLSLDAQQGVLNSILPGGRGKILLTLYELQHRLHPKFGQIGANSGDYSQHVAQQKRNPATKLATGLSELSGQMVTLGLNVRKYVMPVALALLATLAKLVIVLISVFSWFVKGTPLARALTLVLAALAAGITAFIVVTKAATIVGAAWDAVMDANPIVLVVTALAALAVGVIYCYTKFKWFRDAVADVWSWIKAHWPLIAGLIFGPVGLAAAMVIKHWGAIKGFFAVLAGDIGRIFRGVVNGIIAGINFVIGAINTVISAYNSVVGSIPLLGSSLTIGKLGLVGAWTAGGAGHSPARTNLRTGANPRGVATTHASFTKPDAAPAHGNPLIVHGDIVLRVRENELGRVTRRQIHAAMAH